MARLPFVFVSINWLEDSGLARDMQKQEKRYVYLIWRFIFNRQQVQDTDIFNVFLMGNNADVLMP